MDLQRIIEEVVLEGPESSGALLGDRVREAGLDPEVYCAVIPGECGRAGKVNKNSRIYPVGETIVEHERLCREASQRAIPGHDGHPETAEGAQILMRFLGGSHQIAEDGSAVFRGRFGLLNSTLGRDALVTWRAGFPIGTSAYGEGVPVKHKIDDKSPFLSMNESAKGQTVDLVTKYRLKWYDKVKVPSAETYLAAPADVREAVARIREAVEPREVEEKKMDLKEFYEKHPDLAEQVRKEALEDVVKIVGGTAATGNARLHEAQQAVAPLYDRVVKAETALTEAQSKVKDTEVKAKAVEEKNIDLDTRVKALEEREVRQNLRKQVESDVSTALKGKRASGLILEQVMEDFDTKRLSTVEEAKNEAERKAKIAEGAAGTSETPVNLPPPGGSPKVTEASDGGIQNKNNGASTSKVDVLMAE